MVDRDDEAIARQEADETFQSISDLDNISDTMFVAITFLLTGVATWTGFAFDRLAGDPVLQWLYVVLAIGCVLSIVGSVFFLAASLTPRGFYGRVVGERFLDHRWLLWRNDDPVDVETYRENREGVTDEAELARRYEDWLDDYDPGVELTSRESFEFSRLLNYKVVARIKARNTAYGVAFLRIAITLFVVLVVLGLIGPHFV